MLTSSAVAALIASVALTTSPLQGPLVTGKPGQVPVMKTSSQAAGSNNLKVNADGSITNYQDGGGTVSTTFGFGESGIIVADATGLWNCTVASGESGLSGGVVCTDNLGNIGKIGFTGTTFNSNMPLTTACPFKVLNGSGNATMTDNCGPVSGLTVNPNGNPNASTWNISDFSASSGGLQETVSGRIKIKPFCFDDGGCNPGFAQLDIPIDAGTTAIRMTEGAALQFDHLDYAAGTTHEYCVGSGGNLITCGDNFAVKGALSSSCPTVISDPVSGLPVDWFGCQYSDGGTQLPDGGPNPLFSVSMPNSTYSTDTLALQINDYGISGAPDVVVAIVGNVFAVQGRYPDGGGISGEGQLFGVGISTNPSLSGSVALNNSQQTNAGILANFTPGVDEVAIGLGFSSQYEHEGTWPIGSSTTFVESNNMGIDATGTTWQFDFAGGSGGLFYAQCTEGSKFHSFGFASDPGDGGVPADPDAGVVIITPTAVSVRGTMAVTGTFTYNGGKTPAATTDLRSYAIFTGTPTTAVLGSALVQAVFSSPSAGVPSRFAFRVNTAGLGAGSVTISLFDSTTSASKGSATFACTATGDQNLAVTSPTAWATNDAIEMRIDDSACTVASGPIGIPSATVQWQ